MKHVDLVFEALCYFRYVGAEPGSIRAYVGVRQRRKHDVERGPDALAQLEFVGFKRDLDAVARLESLGKIFRVGRKWFLSPAAFASAKGPAISADWNPEDAWVLLALFYCPANQLQSLAQILAVMDFINHAVPTREELHGALNRLKSARLIQLRRGAFAATEKARGLFKRLQANCPRKLLSQLEGLERMLKCPCCGTRLKKVRWNIVLDDPHDPDAL